MITITHLATGSTGNAILVNSDMAGMILLDCGIGIKQIKKGCGNRLSALRGCLVSHEHLDHSLSVPHLLSYGVPVVASRGTWKEMLGRNSSMSPPGSKGLLAMPGVWGRVGPWRVYPFLLAHDAREPVGYLLQTGDERILWATDTAYLPLNPDIPAVDYVILECNYDSETMAANVGTGKISAKQRDRVLSAHMGLLEVQTWLRGADKSRLREVHLIHLSESNANEALILERAREACGVPVYVAQKKGRAIGLS